MGSSFSIQVRISSSLQHVGTACAVARAALREVDWGGDRPEARDYVELALHEALTNVVKHTYRDDPAHEIGVEIQIEEARLTVTVRDWGPPFSLEHVELARPSLQEHGRGVLLIRDTMDEVAYSREEGSNVLRMVKYRQSR